MSFAHRVGDVRICGASTVEGGNDFVEVDGELWSVAGDNNTDGGGGLIASVDWITIEDLPIIIAGDGAEPDSLCPKPPHCNPSAVGFSDLVEIE